MKGVRIGVWTAGMNVALVLLVAAGLVPGAFLLQRKLAAEGARSRVELAALSAVEGLRTSSDEVLTSARLLSERPTLQRLVREGRADELAAFLEQFRGTSQLSGCAVWSGTGVVASVPSSAPWPSLAEGARYFRIADADHAVIASEVPLPDDPGVSVIAVRWLDDALTQKLASQVGLPVHVRFDLTGQDAVTTTENGAWRARRFVASGVCVEVELPASTATAALASVQRRFVLVTCVALLAAIGAGTLAAHGLTRPLAQLQAAAQAIGAGDLHTPVPLISGAETGALAATMEGMRRRLQRATHELHQREAEARALLDGMVEGVFAVDASRRIEYMNSRAAASLGVRVDAAVGRFCGDVLHPVQRDGVRPCDDACPIVHARSRGSSRSVERLEIPGGHRTVVITSSPPAGGRQVQLMRDETETEAARRSRDAVLANVSHELKTPLSAQMASIQLLQEALEEGAEPQASKLVASLERSTLRLSRLIDNLLESVRIETGNSSARAERVDLPALVLEAEAMADPLLRQRRQEIQVELPDSLAPVSGDAAQLTQVFVNLLANANKFAPEGSTIRVGGASDAVSTSVWIEDAGPGIPPSEREAVFEHYYRADPGAAEGMGLGLWIVKAIVERHSGSVAATASALGGARITVSLPLRKEA